MKDDFPEVINFTRVATGPTLLQYQETRIMLDEAIRVDPAFFEMFDFQLIYGDRNTLLNKTNSAVLTESSALKLFNSTDVIGKTVLVRDKAFEVTGIMQNVPQNSHLQFDVIYNFEPENDELWMDNWGGNWLVTYLQLAPNADVNALNSKFKPYLERHIGPGATDYYELYLQQLFDVHLGSANVTHDYRNWKKFDRTYNYIFGILAIFVLAIASINFMNLSTARAANRAREVGIRKTIGAFRSQLIRQFLGESLIFSLISLCLAVAIAELCLPQLNSIIDRELTISVLTKPDLMASLLAVTVLAGLLSGIYPAIFLSSFKPVKVLKGSAGVNTTDTGKQSPLRNILVVSQFTIAIVFIIGTILTIQQLNFMRAKNPGFNREQVLLIDMNTTANKKYDVLKREFRNLGGVKDVTGSMQRLGNNIHQMGIRIATVDSLTGMSPSQLSVDYNYLSFYEIELAEGRAFSEEYSTERQSAFIINETLAEKLGWDSPLGKSLRLGGDDSLGTIIGVVKDFNFNSMHHKIESLVLNVRDWGYSEMSVKVLPENMTETIAALQQKWNRIVPDHPFQYSFLDEHFEQLYRSDKQVTEIVGIIAALAIFIACLGLFGLSTIITKQRTKEISIRKVLGASVPSLCLMLSKHFVLLTGIANLIAWPLAYVILSRWLENFAYRVEINWWIFAIAGTAVLVISLITVSWQAIKAALANPVKSLRYE
ncbi:MAG: ABC transporter permease [Calditrichaeota bacterium]|nr:ABC transporter permease [Calditrichota bacterium]